MGNKIIQLDLDGNFIKEWDNIASIIKNLGYSQGNISSVCSGKRRIANGYRWMFYDDYLNTKDFSLKERKTTSRKINQYSLNGNFIKTFDSISIASKELNILGEKITMVCKGKRFQTGGYFWMYYDNPENIEILEKIKNKEIKFNIFLEENSLEKEYPEIAKRWDYERNGNILPSMVSSHSGIKYFFNCDKGHSFSCKVTHMVDSNIKCPVCSKERKESMPEYVLFFYLKKYFNDTIHSFKASWLGKKELDIFIPSLNIAIEYDGQAWHQDIDRDLEKNKLCKNNNIKLYRIREPKCAKLNDTSIDLYLDGLKDEDLDKTILKLLELLNVKDVSKEIIDSKRDFLEIINLFELNCKKNSILFKSPILEKYWDYTKNGKILPSFVSINSHKQFHWRCPNCNEEWIDEVRKMNKRKVKCPNCKNT